MRRFWTFLLAAAFVFAAFSAQAGVRFITDVPQNTVQGKLPSAYAKSKANVTVNPPVTTKPPAAKTNIWSNVVLMTDAITKPVATKNILTPNRFV